MSVALTPAASYDHDALAALFTAVYAGYWHPIAIDAAALRRMAATYDFDLDASVVARRNGEAVGVAMLAVRDNEAWVGGMGVVPEHRGAGIGEQLMLGLIGEARQRGVTRLRLEVLVENAPAIAIYRSLGFTDLGDVAVWRLDNRPPETTETTETDAADALAELAAGAADAPWQRNPATIVNMRALGSELWAAKTADAGLAAYATTGPTVSVLELDATSPSAAAALLAAPFARDATTVVWANGPVSGVAADTLSATGAVEIARQHHLALAL